MRTIDVTMRDIGGKANGLHNIIAQLGNSIRLPLSWDLVRPLAKPIRRHQVFSDDSRGQSFQHVLLLHQETVTVVIYVAAALETHEWLLYYTIRESGAEMCGGKGGGGKSAEMR